MIEGFKVLKKVDNTIKKATSDDTTSKKKKDDSKKKKGRPTCKRDEEEEKRKAEMAKMNNPNLKFIYMQIDKLENMHVILTTEQEMSKLESSV